MLLQKICFMILKNDTSPGDPSDNSAVNASLTVITFVLCSPQSVLLLKPKYWSGQPDGCSLYIVRAL